MFLVRKRLPTAFVYLYTQCLFLVVLLLLLLSVKLLSAEFAAVSELSDEKFNGPLATPMTSIGEVPEEARGPVEPDLLQGASHVRLELSGRRLVRPAVLQLLPAERCVRRTAQHHVATLVDHVAYSHAVDTSPFHNYDRSPNTTTTTTTTTTTHTHTQPFNCPFSRTTQVSRYQKGKTNLDFTVARDSEWQWYPLGHMQVYTLLQTDNRASTPPLKFFYRPDALPAAQPTASKH